MTSDGCGAPPGGVAAAADAGSQAIVQGKVTQNGSAVLTGYARLLNSGGDFVAEVPLGEDGGFRFFAAPGTWTPAPGPFRGPPLDALRAARGIGRAGSFPILASIRRLLRHLLFSFPLPRHPRMGPGPQ